MFGCSVRMKPLQVQGEKHHGGLQEWQSFQLHKMGFITHRFETTKDG